MNIIYKIARAELRTLFYSPIAWLVLMVFYCISAGITTFALEGYSNFQEVILQMQPDWKGFDRGIGNYIFNMNIGKMGEYLYLFIPLLTMGLINREVVNGTSKLLYSSPVSIKEIVLGKFLGILLFNIIILFIFAFALFTLCYNIENADVKWAFTILLGFFLVMNAYAAMGLFLSSISNYQIVSAILTFVVFFLLNNITSIGQQYDLIRNITYSLSMQGKGTRMIYGLITSRDVIYHLLIMVLFIGFTIIKLESTQQSRGRLNNYLRYASLTLIVIILGYFSSRPRYTAYLDVTKNQSNTIQPVTQQALKKMDGSPLTVTLYTNLLGRKAGDGLPQNRTRYIMNLWEQYLRFYPNVEFKYEYFYDVLDKDSGYYRKYPGKTLDEIAALEAEIAGIRFSLFKKPAEIRKLISLGDEMYMPVMQLEYKGKKTWLRTYNDPEVWPNQEHVAAGIMRVTRSRDPKVFIVNGHYERNPWYHSLRDYQYILNSKTARQSLINKGIDLDSLHFPEATLPPDADLLIVADPRSEYTEQEHQKIINYLNEGGDAIIYTEPGKQHILAPVLKEIGVQADNGIIVRPNKHETPILFTNRLTRAGNFIAKELNMELFQLYNYKGGTVVNDGVVNLSYTETKGFKVTPVVTIPGSADTWIENNKLVVDSATPVFSAADGDIQKPEYVTTIALNRKINGREQRIIVAGDADFMSHKRMLGSDQIGLAPVSYAMHNIYPPYANPPLPQDRYLTITNVKAKLLLKVYMYGIASLMLLSAIILLVRRKRK